MATQYHSWTCAQCGDTFERYVSQVQNPERPFCSLKCRGKGLDTRGANNPNWRGGSAQAKACACGRTMDYRAKLCAVCARCGYPAAGQVRPMPTPEEVKRSVSASSDLSSAALSLGLSRQLLRRLAREAGLDLAHMKPGRGRPSDPRNVFVVREKRAGCLVRSALLRLEPEIYFCAWCGIGPEWREASLTLQLDHINGDPRDDRRGNLRWLCPNCHSQTSTFTGRNRKKPGEHLL